MESLLIRYISCLRQHALEVVEIKRTRTQTATPGDMSG